MLQSSYHREQYAFISLRLDFLLSHFIFYYLTIILFILLFICYISLLFYSFKSNVARIENSFLAPANAPLYDVGVRIIIPIVNDSATNATMPAGFGIPVISEPVRNNDVK